MSDQESARKEPDPVSPTMREMAILLFRQRKVFIGVAGVVLVLAVVYAFAGAAYRAHVRVLVRRGRADPPVTAQPNAPLDFSRVEVTEEELNSEVELLKDDDVLRHVVEAGAHRACAHEGEAAGVNRTGAREREAGANRACAHEGEAGCGPGAWRLPTKDRRAGRRRANFEVTEPSHGSERGKGRDEIWRAGCAVGRTACENLDHAARRKDRAPDQRAFLNHGRRDCSRNSSSLQFACFDLGICPAISRL